MEEGPEQGAEAWGPVRSLDSPNTTMLFVRGKQTQFKRLESSEQAPVGSTFGISPGSVGTDCGERFVMKSGGPRDHI